MDSLMNDKIISYYTQVFDESKRLTDGFGKLERARTEELICRFLPSSPSQVLDVGGGTGIYSFFIAGLGHAVHLFDLVPKHIEQAEAKSRMGGMHLLSSMRVGDARRLGFEDRSMDAVLLHGPLYHLTEKNDRGQVLSEAWRVLRPNGILLAFAVTRYAGTFYGISSGHIYREDYRRMIRREVISGVRSNPPQENLTLPEAFFHLPEELCNEVGSAGFQCESILGIVGPAWMVPDLDEAWEIPAKRDSILEMARLLENEPLLGPRMLAVAQKIKR